jgi:hypothetical protein
VFLLARSATVDRVIDAIKPYNPTVIQTNLTKDREEELVKALQAGPAEAGGGAARARRGRRALQRACSWSWSSRGRGVAWLRNSGGTSSTAMVARR